MRIHYHRAMSGSSHLLDGVFLGVSVASGIQKSHKLLGFSTRFESICYGAFMIIYYITLVGN